MPSNSDQVAVRVQNLHVRFQTRRDRGAVKRRGLDRLRPRTRRTVLALKGVTFDVPWSSVYGVIGHNGAGKSTLLRTMAGILHPTKGRVITFGRVSPLLSLGLGFNRELSGRENILLGGLSYGLHEEEIRAKAEEIIKFADIGEAIDFPMRTYSNGMYARVGFGVAVTLEPEIILIDEALGAGDASFQEKSRSKIVELCQGDCTVIVVSHGMAVIKAIADRCVWIDHGLVRDEGPTDGIAEAYLESQGLGQQLQPPPLEG